MPKRNKFRSWLYDGDLAETARYLGVTKTTVREWRTGRAYPHPLRRATLITKAAERGYYVPAADLIRSAK